MQKVIIDNARVKDLPGVLSVQKAAFTTEASFYDFFEMAPLTETLVGIKQNLRSHTILKATLESKIVGSVRGYVNGESCYISRLSVHPRYWNRGIGKALMKAIEETFRDARRYELLTGSRSDRNINLYLHLGYHPYKFERVNDKLTFVYMEKENP